MIPNMWFHHHFFNEKNNKKQHLISDFHYTYKSLIIFPLYPLNIFTFSLYISRHVSTVTQGDAESDVNHGDPGREDCLQHSALHPAVGNF